MYNLIKYDPNIKYFIETQEIKTKFLSSAFAEKSIAFLQETLILKDNEL